MGVGEYRLCVHKRRDENEILDCAFAWWVMAPTEGNGERLAASIIIDIFRSVQQKHPSQKLVKKMQIYRTVRRKLFYESQSLRLCGNWQVHDKDEFTYNTHQRQVRK